MELRYLRYFVTVAECQHFTRAAEKLGIAQPPLSQQIKKLEQEVGVPLFERLSRGVALTPAGQVLYDDAVKILAQLDHAVQRVKQVARGERNQLRLGFASSTVVSQAVLELVRRLQQSHPDIDFSTDRVTHACAGGDLAPAGCRSRLSSPAVLCQ
jgi:Transcriptional regulator